MFTEMIFLIFSKVSQATTLERSLFFFFYRMNKGFHFSCTTMLAVPMNTTPSSVWIRLCFPMATLYSLPLLEVDREKNMKQWSISSEILFKDYISWCFSVVSLKDNHYPNHQPCFVDSIWKCGVPNKHFNLLLSPKSEKKSGGMC